MQMMTAFRLIPLDDSRFAVADAANEIQFVGSLAECEQWLDGFDHAPSAARRDAPPPALNASLEAPPKEDVLPLYRRLWHRLFGR